MKYRKASFDRYGIYTVRVDLREGTLKVIFGDCVRLETKAMPSHTIRARQPFEYVVIVGGCWRRHASPYSFSHLHKTH